MATYVYETVPEPGGEPVRTYEFKQSMKDAAYTRHPETGEPIRRVISGGMGILAGSKGGSPAPRGGGHSCGSGCGCG
jgi:predicted nucleic acid-binding Zn ribbon protein